MKNKFIRIMGALGPFIVLAIYPLYKLTRHRSGPELLMASSAFLLSAVYIVIDLAQLEYKYVLAATICLAFLAVIVVDTLFFHHHRARSIIGIIVLVGLAGINLLLVFKTGSHVPGNLSQAPPLDESSFQLSLSPSDQDSDWTRAIQESTTENTVIIARKPGVQLSVLVGRSMYVPSDSAGGQIPGYNLKHRSHLIYQRGYPEELYNQRIGDVDTLYMSEDESKIEDALHRLKELQRPLAIHFTQNNTYSLNYLGKNALGKEIYSDSKNIVWLIDDPNTLP